jgi:hypothetical protein
MYPNVTMQLMCSVRSPVFSLFQLLSGSFNIGVPSRSLCRLGGTPPATVHRQLKVSEAIRTYPSLIPNVKRRISEPIRTYPRLSEAIRTNPPSPPNFRGYPNPNPAPCHIPVGHPDSRTARLTMKTAAEAPQRHPCCSIFPAPRRLPESVRSLRSTAATPVRRSLARQLGRSAVKFRLFQGNPGFLRLFEGRKKSCRHHGPTPTLPHQAYSSPIKVRQKNAQSRQRHNTSQVLATAAGPSDFRISAFSPDSSPIKPNQGDRPGVAADLSSVAVLRRIGTPHPGTHPGSSNQI